MTSALRRSVRNRFAGHDWLEGAATVVGFVFLGVAIAAVVGIVTAIAASGTEAPEAASEGFLRLTRGFAVLWFTVIAVLAGGVGWFLAGSAVRRLGGRLRRRG